MKYRKYLLETSEMLVLLTLFCTIAFSQKYSIEERSGTVTFQSSQNIYSKFDNVEGVQQGDTLFVKLHQSLSPAVLVQFLSSHSCAGKKLLETPLKVGDTLFCFAKVLIKEQPVIVMVDSSTSLSAEQKTDPINGERIRNTEKPFRWNGRYSVQSYSNISNNAQENNFQRWRYLFAFDAERIGGRDISLSSYFTFSYRSNEWASVKSNLSQNVRVYNVDLTYDVNKTSRVTFGRNINQKISSISAIDGIQYETFSGKYFGGAIVGSRPNDADYGYNAKLFEVGGYIGMSDTVFSRRTENTFAIFQQTNNFKTDRRFLYVQHTNSFFTNTEIFLSSEIEAYERIAGVNKNSFTLSNIYFLSRYSPSDWISLNASYDARKNVIYYETFKNTADSLFDRETRQGLRLGTNFRINETMSLGLNYGRRFQQSDPKPSQNYSGFFSYNAVPFIASSASLSMTTLKSSFIDGSTYEVRLSKDFVNGDVYSSIGFNKTRYVFLNSPNELSQNSILTELSWLVVNNVHVSFSYEGVYEKSTTYGRILIDISSRL